MNMTYDVFCETLSHSKPEVEIDEVLEALWYDKNGEWDRAHRIVQSIPTSIASAVHAYLHRKEGDIGNARYWYGRANREESSNTLDEEWVSLAKEITTG